MKFIRLLQRMRRHQEGATAVEFAIVAVMFFTLMFGVIEFGMIMFTKVAVESALVQATRGASLGLATPACDRACTITKLVQDKTGGLVKSNSISVTSTVVTGANTASATIPDICLDNPNNAYPTTCPSGAAYINNNGVAGYQKTNGVTNASVGSAGDLVEIRVTYLWRVLFPLFEIFQSATGDASGKKGYFVITSSAVIKNEPF